MKISVRAAAMAGVATALWLGISAVLLRPSMREGAISYVDADCHMRLERVAEIVERGQYPFDRFPRSNPPIGETSHWGLPTDLLLMAGAAALAPTAGSFAAGLQAWSVWVGPALFGVFALVLMRCAMRFGGTVAGGMLVIFLLGSQAILHPFLPARPDHHGLLLLLHALAFASLASAEMSSPRGIGRRPPGGWAILMSAAFTATAVWASVESCAFVALAGGWLAMRVGWPGSSVPPARFQMLLRWAAALWFALLGAWVIERGGIGGAPLWGSDALSLRFLVPGGIALVALIALSGSLSSADRKRRFLALAGVVLATAAAWVFPARLFPGLPIPETDFALMLGFLDKASTDGMPMFGGPTAGARNFLEWYGAIVLLLPFACAGALRAKGTRGAIARLTLTCAVAYTVLGFLKMRWCSYAMAFAAPVVACWLAATIRRWLPHRRAETSRTLAWCIALTASVLIGFSGRIAVSNWSQPSAHPIPTRELDAALRAAHAAWKTDLAARGIKSRRVLTHAALGPQVMRGWNAAVVATPNVRNGAGIRKLFGWLLSTDPGKTLREIWADGWAYALIISDPFPPEMEAYRRFAGITSDPDATLLGLLDRCPAFAVVGQWPLGPAGATLKLIRLPASDAEIAPWSAPRGREP